MTLAFKRRPKVKSMPFCKRVVHDIELSNATEGNQSCLLDSFERKDLVALKNGFPLQRPFLCQMQVSYGAKVLATGLILQMEVKL